MIDDGNPDGPEAVNVADDDDPFRDIENGSFFSRRQFEERGPMASGVFTFPVYGQGGRNTIQAYGTGSQTRRRSARENRKDFAEASSGLSNILGVFGTAWLCSKNLSPLGKYVGGTGIGFAVTTWGLKVANIIEEEGSIEKAWGTYEFHFATWPMAAGIVTTAGSSGYITPAGGFFAGMIVAEGMKIVVNFSFDKPAFYRTIFE